MYELLQIKHLPPVVRPETVHRSHLINRLEDSIVRHRTPLILVNAAAGTGKTVLLADWLQYTDLGVAWLSLDANDNDPLHFFRYLLNAWRQMAPQIGENITDLLETPNNLSLQSFLIPILNQILQIDQALTIILDDYHTITNTQVHELVQFILDNQPPNLHLIISTRTTPPLNLPNLRAQGRLSEIEDADLRFSLAETTEFLARRDEIVSNTTLCQAIHTQTEGWITGIQLVTLTLQKAATPDLNQLPPRSRTYVFDYLMAEVFKQLPSDMANFLRQTSILTELNPAVCDYLTEQSDSAEKLQDLAKHNLFLTALNADGDWYRYHRLFTEFLQQLLSQDERAHLHHRMVAWSSKQGQFSIAIDHALAYGQLTDDFGLAVELLETHCETVFHQGHIHILQNWLAQLPATILDMQPHLATYQGYLWLFQGNSQDLYQLVQQIQATLTDPAWSPFLVLQTYLAMAQEDYSQVIRLAQQVISQVDGAAERWRIIAYWHLAEAWERTAPIGKAVEVLTDAYQLTLKSSDVMFDNLIPMFLAYALQNQGKPYTAIAICEETLQRQQRADGTYSPYVALLLMRLGALYYDFNELDTAQDYFQQALELAHQLGLPIMLSPIYGMFGLTAYASGDMDQSLALFEKALDYGSSQFMVDTRWIQAYEAEIHLRLGNLTQVAIWQQRNNLSITTPPEYLNIEALHTYARYLIATQQYTDAQILLHTIEEHLISHDLQRWQVTTYLLLAQLAPTDTIYLEKAIRLAAQFNLQRPFWDDCPLTRLADMRHLAPHFIDQFNLPATELPWQPTEAYQIYDTDYYEDLTSREFEILQLIAQGYSNQEIADQLVIAHSTVKRHINHVYSKLDVSQRTKAIVKAKQLGIL